MERIEKIKIPDEDVPGWMQTLREGGFTNEEIDTILSHNNREYAKGLGADRVADELSRIEKYLKEEHGSTLTNEQREYLRRGIASRPEFKD